MLEVYKNLGANSFEGLLVRVGYTQGEVSEDFEDFDDGFNASKHCYWNFIILRDLKGECEGREYLLMDLDSSGMSFGGSEEEISSKIADICNSQTEEMFGEEFPSSAFESVVLGAIDEPRGYDCINDVLGNIGGSLDEHFGVVIPEQYVNSLFSYSMFIGEERLSIENDSILIDGEGISLDEVYAVEPRLICFSEDVMNYSS
jgi:hypothetical protein